MEKLKFEHMIVYCNPNLFICCITHIQKGIRCLITIGMQICYVAIYHLLSIPIVVLYFHLPQTEQENFFTVWPDHIIDLFLLLVREQCFQDVKCKRNIIPNQTFPTNGKYLSLPYCWILMVFPILLAQLIDNLTL